MFGLFKKLLGAKSEAPEREYYTITQDEIKWAAQKIRFNQRKYMTKFKLSDNGVLSDWHELAALHYILFRLNFAKLNDIKPSALSNYSQHYYYKAGLQILAKLGEE